VLNHDHFGLEKVKERILEYLAVQQRMRKVKGPILCLVGPPGVGQDLPRQVDRARANRPQLRPHVRWAAVRDEAEIRGHRRTYIGSMPGKVIQGMKKAKSSNPLFLLDEVGQAGRRLARRSVGRRCWRCSTPSRTRASTTTISRVDYDLSDVMFVTTANTLRMPQPLLDRMELIRIPRLHRG